MVLIFFYWWKCYILKNVMLFMCTPWIQYRAGSSWKRSISRKRRYLQEHFGHLRELFIYGIETWISSSYPSKWIFDWFFVFTDVWHQHNCVKRSWGCPCHVCRHRNNRRLFAQETQQVLFYNFCFQCFVFIIFLISLCTVTPACPHEFSLKGTVDSKFCFLLKCNIIV